MKKKKEKRKQSFYTNSHRDTHWTEEPKGRPIDFAEKYIDDGSSSNKYSDQIRAKHQKEKQQKERKQKLLKTVGSIVLVVVLLFGGYTAMDVRMIRHSEGAKALLQNEEQADNALSQIYLVASSLMIESLSLDNSTILDSVINDVHDFGSTSVTFDAKREDGTIGYQSSLATIDTFGAMSNVGNDCVGSIKVLTENDILPIARICCYKDNVLPLQDKSYAIMKGKKLFKDNDGNTYLNPNNPLVYNYIRDVIRELNDYGIQVFVLYDCDLPESISKNYDDGFKYIAKKLNAEFNGKIKILEEVNVSVRGYDAESGNITDSAIENNIKEFNKINRNQIYNISTELDKARVYEKLVSLGIERFII